MLQYLYPRLRSNPIQDQSCAQHESVEDQLIDEARKTYESAVWRYQYKQDFFSDIELKTTWEYRNQLAFEPIVWKAVASTLVRDWQPDRLDWLIHYPTEISAALQKAVSGKVEDESAERAYLMLACLQNTAEQHTQAAKMVLATIANKDPDEQARLTAVEGLAFLGETARDALTEIAGNSPFESVRLEAAEGLSGLGEAGRGELAFLTWNRPRDSSRRRAAGWLGFLGTDDPEAMIEIEAMLPEVDPGELVDMARNHPDELRRMKAAGWLAYLGKMGIARDVLVDLAWKSPHEGMRIDAADGLADLEETQIAREVLADLAHNSPDETMRLEAVEKLASLGETQMAREALAELAKKSSTEEVRIEAAEELARLGEEQIAREVLVELARNSPDEGLRWRAAEGLAGLGEKLYLLSCTLEDILFSERIFRLLHFVIDGSHFRTSGR